MPGSVEALVSLGGNMDRSIDGSQCNRRHLDTQAGVHELEPNSASNKPCCFCCLHNSHTVQY